MKIRTIHCEFSATYNPPGVKRTGRIVLPVRLMPRADGEGLDNLADLNFDLVETEHGLCAVEDEVQTDGYIVAVSLDESGWTLAEGTSASLQRIVGTRPFRAVFTVTGNQRIVLVAGDRRLVAVVTDNGELDFIELSETDYRALLAYEAAAS